MCQQSVNGMSNDFVYQNESACNSANFPPTTAKFSQSDDGRALQQSHRNLGIFHWELSPLKFAARHNHYIMRHTCKTVWSFKASGYNSPLCKTAFPK